MVKYRKTKWHKWLPKGSRLTFHKGHGGITDHRSRNSKERRLWSQLHRVTKSQTSLEKKWGWTYPEGRGDSIPMGSFQTWVKIIPTGARKKSMSWWSRRSWEGVKYEIDFIREGRDRGLGDQAFEFSLPYNVEVSVINQERKGLEINLQGKSGRGELERPSGLLATT